MNGRVIVEGPGLLPELLAEHQVRPSHVLYLLPTPSYQRSANRRRGDGVDEVLVKTDNPESAWERWMELDEQFASHLSKSASDQNYRVLWNNGSRSPKEIARLAEQYFCR